MANADPLINRLWTIRDLAAYLNYQESTIASMISRCPEKLPPRVASLGKPRWEPDTVRQWAKHDVRSPSKKGRPRNTPPGGTL